MCKSGPVRPSRCQSVVYIGDAKDARRERDFFTGETVGVPFSVPTLLVVSNDRSDVSGKINVGDELEPGLRMPLHYCPLFLGQLARFVQYLSGYDDLSDVMQQRPNPEPE